MYFHLNAAEFPRQTDYSKTTGNLLNKRSGFPRLLSIQILSDSFFFFHCTDIHNKNVGFNYTVCEVSFHIFRKKTLMYKFTRYGLYILLCITDILLERNIATLGTLYKLIFCLVISSTDS